MAADRAKANAQSYLSGAGRKIAALDPFQSAWQPNGLALLVMGSMSFVLAARQLYVAPDDHSYIQYFSADTDWYQELVSESTDWWLLILNEPLWNIYTIVTGSALGPETAFRVTIFFSTFLYLFFGARLSRDNWAISILLFVLDSNIGSQMYFNQVRQGVALSVFFTLVSILKRLTTPARIAVASGIAVLIHSSFIAVFATVVFYIFTPNLRIMTALAAGVAIIGMTQYVDIYEFVNAGRREGVYGNAGLLNINYYILTIPTYGAIFYLLWPGKNRVQIDEWYYLTFVVAATVLGITFIHEAGARVAYISEAMICTLIAANVRSKTGIIALGIWLFAIAISIISDFQYDASTQASMILRWQAILGLTN